MLFALVVLLLQTVVSGVVSPFPCSTYNQQPLQLLQDLYGEDACVPVVRHSDDWLCVPSQDLEHRHRGLHYDLDFHGRHDLPKPSDPERC